MEFAVIDFWLLVVTLLLILGFQLIKNKLPETLLIKTNSSRVMFSIERKKGALLIPGMGFYVWAMNFLILNSAIAVRLVSTLVIQFTFVAAFVITNLINQELGKILAAVGIVVFIGSVAYLV